MDTVLDAEKQAKVNVLCARGFSQDAALIAVLLMELNHKIEELAGRIDAIPAGPVV